LEHIFLDIDQINNKIKAVIISSILIILYIWWRFQVMSGLSAGVTAVLALLHDVAIMISVYLLFRIPWNESFIAAILTILGYSMNDTVIIYDRIRENSKAIKKVGLVVLTNRSINETLSRTINTMLTTFIAIMTVYVFAVVNNIRSIEEFALPLVVGMVSGSYSSIFIASPLWVMWKQVKAKNTPAPKDLKPAKGKA
jgi:preprotein translocase subunit SecF